VKHTVKTGRDCVSIDGRDHSFKDAVKFAYQITVAVELARALQCADDEIVHAAERMAHDSVRDQREGDRL